MCLIKCSPKWLEFPDVWLQNLESIRLGKTNATLLERPAWGFGLSSIKAKINLAALRLVLNVRAGRLQGKLRCLWVKSLLHSLLQILFLGKVLKQQFKIYCSLKPSTKQISKRTKVFFPYTESNGSDISLFFKKNIHFSLCLNFI